jgi:peptidoglycan/xylan/chitin deacetylase (PgdA/CDA1 family)
LTDVSGRFRAAGKDAVRTALAMLPARVSHGRVVVLCYHSVHPSADYPSTTRPELFERHMRWLRRECEVITFIDAARPRAAMNEDRPRVAVTFDDGFADNHRYALPILVRQDIPATFFIATGLIERETAVIRARSWRGWDEEGSTLTWDQVRDLRRAGMEIGSHGHSHRVLTRLSEEELVADLSSAKLMLEDRLEDGVSSFAYPKGRPRRDVGPRTMELARDVGYEQAGTVLFRAVRAVDRPMGIPRFPIADDDLSMLRGKVLGNLDVVGIWQERAPLWALRLAGP